MADDVIDEQDDPEGTLVIFSLSVNSERPIAALAGMPGRGRAARPDDDWFYNIAHSSFTERDAYTRADRLESEVIAALDRLDETGVSLDELHRDDVVVRAFFTFDIGAETISAPVVARLARVNATIWIDAIDASPDSG